MIAWISPVGWLKALPLSVKSMGWSRRDPADRRDRVRQSDSAHRGSIPSRTGMNVVYHPEFPKDIRRYREQYDEVSERLGMRFANEISVGIERIKCTLRRRGIS